VTEDQKLRMMQNALDGDLSAEEQAELDAQLQADSESAAQFDRLKQVDDMLQRAPHQRAPRRLAATIMARLSKMVEEEKQQSPITEEMMEAVIQLVTASTMPLLVGAGWLLLNAQSDPETLEVVLQEVTALLILVIDTVEVILDEAQQIYPEDPELAMAALSLMPIAILTIMQQVLNIDD
jgi:anti-sigma factor RsiW